MKLRNIAIAAILLTTIARATDHVPGTTYMLPFRTNSHGHMLVDMTVDGRQYTMLFDTGAEKTVLDSPRNVQHNSVLGIPTEKGFLLNLSVDLVDLHGSYLEKVVLQNGAQGLLGQNFIRKFSTVSIDYKTSTIQLTE